MGMLMQRSEKRLKKEPEKSGSFFNPEGVIIA
jgi:hypothetical protein